MQTILQLIVQTFFHPREIAAGLTAERYDRTTLWTGVFLVCILSGVTQYLVVLATPMPEPTPQSLFVMSMFSTPFLTTLLLGCALIVTIFAVYFTGRMLGGTGHFPETLVLMTWLQFVQVAISMVQIVLLSLSAQFLGIATLFKLVAAGGVLYATLHFIDVLHGYNSLWASFGTLVISTLGLAIGAAIIFAMIGGAAVQAGAI